ncbi:MAG: hypothetical protein QGH37_27350 [Candidatus Poribacteria bacterium]|nr:hypothetical protein [Candidatus Poribacteria bacterium]
MTHKSKVRLIVDPTGLAKIELYGLPNDIESKEATLELYGKLALVIHRFGEHAQEVLFGTTEKQGAGYADNF